MDPNLATALERENLDEVTLRAAQFASSRMAKYLWRGHKGGRQGDFSPGGMSAADFVSEAIRRLLSSQRTYNPAKSLLENVNSVVESLIWSAKKSVENNLLADYVAPAGSDADGFDPISSAMGHADAEVIPNEVAEAQRAVFQNLSNSFDGDKEAQDYLQALELGVKKPQEIADLMKLDVKKVYELRRKVMTQAKSIFGVQNSKELERIILEGKS